LGFSPSHRPSWPLTRVNVRIKIIIIIIVLKPYLKVNLGLDPSHGPCLPLTRVSIRIKNGYYYNFKTWFESQLGIRLKSQLGMVNPSWLKQKKNQNNLVLAKKLYIKKLMDFSLLFCFRSIDCKLIRILNWIKSD
jgi:hypothetical protein